MASTTTLNGLNAMKDRWSIVVRVLRKWNVFKKTIPAEFFCSTMVLIDREVLPYSLLFTCLFYYLFCIAICSVDSGFLFHAGNENSGKHSREGS